MLGYPKHHRLRRSAGRQRCHSGRFPNAVPRPASRSDGYRKIYRPRDSRITFSVIHGWLAFGGPAMRTKMTEEDWVLVLEVFHACRSRRGDKGRDDRKFFRSLALFHGPQRYVASAAGRVRVLYQHLEALLALELQRRVRNFLRSARL